MKKIAMLLMVLLLTLMIFVQPTYAISPPVTDEISGDLTWSRSSSGGYYYIQSNRITIDFSGDVEMEFGSSLGDWTQAFVAAAGDFNSVLEISNGAGTILKTYNISYETPDVPEVLFLFDSAAQDYKVDLRSYQDMYMQITLLLNPIPEPVSPSLVTNVEFWMNNYRSEYAFNIMTYRDVLLDQTIASLPVTAGNPYQTGLTGDVTSWVYQELTNSFYASINYYSEYNVEIPNVGFSADSFLDRVETIDYYTIEDEKFFQFNYIQNDNVLLTPSGEYASLWNTFALWNLTTNEFVMYNKALALTYIEVTEDRQIYGYLYLPNIPVEDLIAVSGSFNYRYGYKNIFGTQKYDDWEKTIFFLDKDVASFGSTSVFEGALPQWSYDLLAGSIAATAVGTILSLVPGMQPAALTLLAAGVAGIIAGDVGAIEHVVTGKTDELETITPTQDFKYKLNEHYTLASGITTVLPSNAEVHKLYYGLFTKTGTNVVEPDASTLVYTEITWATKGEVYTLDQKIIDSDAVLDQDYLNSLPAEGTGSWFDDLFAGAPTWVIILAVILAAAIVLPYIDKALSSASSITKNPRKLFILAVIVIAILIFTGIIRI